LARLQVRSFIGWFIALATASLALAPAYAQQGPGSLERTVPKFEPQRAEKQSKVATPGAPRQESATISGTFVLSAVNVEGSTVFTSEQLAQSFEPYLASRIGQAELEKIAADITARYRRAGYLLSYAMIPEQSVQSGIVTIRVVEGYIDHVDLLGDAKSASAIRAIVARLREDRPLRSATLERILGLARETPGVVMGEVRIGRSAANPAQHQLTIALGADRYRALLYSDNRGTIEGARIRRCSSLVLSSVAVPGDQLQVDLFAIPSNHFRYYYGQLKGSVPLNADGLRLSASASYGDEFQRFAGPDQRGMSRQFIADLSYPLVKSRASSMVGHFSLSDWKSREKLGSSAFQRDNLQVARGWIEFSKASRTRVDGRITLSRGFDLGAPRGVGDPLASRPFGKAEFTKVTADLQVARSLSEKVGFRFDSSAQLSLDPLLAPEEFALGGSRIGRAFDFNAVTGDSGFGGMLELNYRLGDKAKSVKGLELFAYADGGGAFRKHQSAGLPKQQWIASVGTGARFSAAGILFIGEVGVPVARDKVKGGVRAFFSVAKAF
jgi:hemolysin activation/secretion protein